MNITIHRGAHQIGGCITEISTEGCKILIDLGSNLPGCKNEELTATQVEEITRGADAIFYTHNHCDHVGLLHLVLQDIPQYMGAGARKVMMCKYNALKLHGDYSKQIEVVERMVTYTAGWKYDVAKKGKIFVTPFFVDHSCFDAYMFMIECEGKKILYTGDFRGHGYLGKLLLPMLRKHVGQVDVLITEGTMLGRQQERVVSENDIKRNVIGALCSHKYVYALCSSGDLERLASFHSACKETGRVFLADKYQKSVLDVFSEYAGTKSDLFNFDKVFEVNNYKSPKVRAKLQGEGFLMPIRVSGKNLVRGMMDLYNDEQPWLIYSMWSGYAERGEEYSNEDVTIIRSYFENRIFDGAKDGFHTSGHADVETLQAVCNEVNPCAGIIPIHKAEKTRFESLSKVKSFKFFTEGEQLIDNCRITIVD